MFKQYKQEVVNDNDPFHHRKHLKRDIKPTYKRLYEDASKPKQNGSPNKKYSEDNVDHHFNRGGLSRNVSQSNILAERKLLS